MIKVNEGKYLYIANSYYNGEIFTKIGTTININQRLKPIITNSPLLINSIFYTYKKWPLEAIALEKLLHLFMDNNIHHEWYKTDHNFFNDVEEFLNHFEGNLNWDDRNEVLEYIELNCPSLDNYMDEIFELLTHYSSFNWKCNLYNIDEGRIFLESTNDVLNFSQMYNLITNKS